MKIKKTFFFLICVFLFSLPFVTNGLDIQETAPGPKHWAFVESGLANILSWVATIVVLGFLVYAAILFAIAAGEPDKISKAKKMFLYAIIGIVVILIAFIIRIITSETFKNFTWEFNAWEPIKDFLKGIF